MTSCGPRRSRPATRCPDGSSCGSAWHAELLTGLADDELSALGPRARDLIGAVTAATGAPATYLLHFGENYRHFHALVAARGADIPAELRGGNILGLRPGHVDIPAALTLASAVREAYERACHRDRSTVRARSVERPGQRTSQQANAPASKPTHQPTGRQA